MNTLVAGIVAIAAIIGVASYARRGRKAAVPLRAGEALPDFHAIDEQGHAVRSADLLGTATVILFVRGNWCPFCSAQVESLTAYYKSIVDLGGRLIFITPKPLETTRRVAEFYEVEFDFWLDESLEIARQFELLDKNSVPPDRRNEYGTDTVRPTALVVDREGIVRFVQRSKTPAERPDAENLLRELKKAISD